MRTAAARRDAHESLLFVAGCNRGAERQNGHYRARHSRAASLHRCWRAPSLRWAGRRACRHDGRVCCVGCRSRATRRRPGGARSGACCVCRMPGDAHLGGARFRDKKAQHGGGGPPGRAWSRRRSDCAVRMMCGRMTLRACEAAERLCALSAAAHSVRQSARAGQSLRRPLPSHVAPPCAFRRAASRLPRAAHARACAARALQRAAMLGFRRLVQTCVAGTRGFAGKARTRKQKADVEPETARGCCGSLARTAALT